MIDKRFLLSKRKIIFIYRYIFIIILISYINIIIVCNIINNIIYIISIIIRFVRKIINIYNMVYFDSICQAIPKPSCHK